MDWNDHHGDNGLGAYVNIKADGFEYELFAWRMDDVHTSTYKSNATGYKYAWSLDTTELFYPGGDGTILVSGYTMTLEETKEKLEKAFENRNKYRKEWRKDAKK